MPSSPSAVVTEPRGLDVSRVELPPPPVAAPQAAMMPFATPTPLPAVGGGSPPPVPDEALPASSQAEIVTAPRELPRPMASRSAPADSGSAPARTTDPAMVVPSDGALPRTEAGRRGLDDTHPGYQMASKPPADTQPRVVLDEAALHHETGEIVPGILEEPPSSPGRAGAGEDSISIPGRPKSGRRPRGGTPVGLPAMPRGTGSARAVPRPPGPEIPPPERVDTDDSIPVLIVEDDGQMEQPRDAREETRRTPTPTRPGEGNRRAQREEPRHPAAPEPARKRSWGWFALSLVLLLGAAAAVYATLPMIEELVKSKLEDVKPAEPGTTRIQPTPVPSGPPGMVPAAPPSAPEAAVPSPAPAAPSPAPTEAVAAAPQEANEADSGSAAVVDDDLVPLPSAPTATPAKKNPGSRPGKKTSPQVRSKEAQELKSDWTQTKGLFARLTQDTPCESFGLTCSKYQELRRDVAALGDNGFDRVVHDRVRKMRTELGNLLRNK
jgi:hypothetical protein